jgi:hypothetical protein
MKKIGRLFCVLLLFMAAVQCFAGDECTVLWRKAMAVYELNKNWVPGRVITHTEMLNKKGEVENTIVMEMTQTMDENGTVHSTIVRAVEDGKDITGEAREEEKKDREKKKKKGEDVTTKVEFSMNSSSSLFHPDAQKNITLEQDEIKTVQDRECVGINFVQIMTGTEKNTPQKKIGTVWLDRETGIPWEMETTFDPLPKRFKEMTSRYIFSVNASGDHTIKKVVMNGAGKFLFMTIRIHSRTEFSEHWKYLPAGENGS